VAGDCHHSRWWQWGATRLSRTDVLYWQGPPSLSPGDPAMASVSYAELHCHSHFSFLDGASAPDELVERAVALGLTGLAISDHQGLYGVVRFATAAREAGLNPIVGLEIELVDALVDDPRRIVVPARRPLRHARPTPAE